MIEGIYNTTYTEYHDNDAPETIVSFTSFKGVDNASITDPADSPRFMQHDLFSLTKQNKYNVMFVTDKKNSWYNWLNTRKIIKQLDGKPVIAIGLSMGGYNAIQFARDYPYVRRVVALVPQYSWDTDIVPEFKWTRSTKQIREGGWTRRKLNFVRRTIYHIISGNTSRELAHTDKIPDYNNITKYIMDGGHDVAMDLKSQGLLWNMLYEMIDGKDDLAKEVSLNHP